MVMVTARSRRIDIISPASVVGQHTCHGGLEITEGIMRELAGKAAFITGGASGIGFALGRAFAEAGMKVMLADIEAAALAAALRSHRDFGPNIRGVACDHAG